MTKARVFIWGSCVSRDTLEHFVPDEFELLHYIARQSAISAIAPPTTRMDPPSLQSSFQTRMVEGDYASSLIGQIGAHARNIDLLLVDLVDERHGVYVLPDGSVVTRSNELIQSGAEAQLAQMATHVPFGSEEHFAQWQRAMHAIGRYFRSSIPHAAIAILAPPWATISDSGKPTPRSFGVDSNEANRAFRRYTQEAIAALDARVFTPKLDKVRSSASHPWGEAPFHYSSEVYLDLVEQLTGTPGRRPWTDPAVAPSHASPIIAATSSISVAPLPEPNAGWPNTTPTIINSYRGPLPAWWGTDEPDFAPTVEIAKDALVSQSDIYQWPRKVRSAVYSSDLSEIDSTVFRRQGRVSITPEIRPTQSAEQLDGKFVYLGWLIGHFGHFLTESLSRTWYLREHDRFDGYIFHSNFRSKDELPEHVRVAFKLLGIPLDKVILARQDYRVRELHCPSESLRCDHSSSRYHSLPYTRMTTNSTVVAENASDRLFVSRKSLTSDPRRTNEDEAWQVFRAHGFRRIYPELMRLDEQIATFSAARIIAGPVGTAMHNAAFMNPGSRALILAPSHFLLRNDRLLSNACGYDLNYFLTDSGLEGIKQEGWTIDPRELEAHIQQVL